MKGNVRSRVLPLVPRVWDFRLRGVIWRSEPRPTRMADHPLILIQLEYLKHSGTTALRRIDEYLKLLPLGL